MRIRLLFRAFLISLALLSIFPSRNGHATFSPGITNDQVTLHFPDSLTFSASIQGEETISSVILEYGVEQLTCGTVIAKAIPQFTPARNVNVEWTWEMKQSGSLPPGATIWWRWQVTDSLGHETLTESRTVIWLDAHHDWQKISGGQVNLHWYQGDLSFGQDLHDAAVQGLLRLEEDAGLKADLPIDLYIYADSKDMRDAILYEPSWTGGMAFPEQDIVIIGIASDEIDWGKRTEIHELTHVLVGHLTFSCLGDVPTWLNEGLAVYSEGELDEYSQTRLQNAIQEDTLLSVRSLSGGFSEIADKADLSYSESYSIVKFLIEKYGRVKMTTLLLALRDGTTIDDALRAVYGFNVDGLEDTWRLAINARPRAVVPNATPTSLPTHVPTIIPFSGSPVVATYKSPPTQEASGFSTNTPEPFVPFEAPQREVAAMTRNIIITLVCCLLLIFMVLGGVIFMIIRRKKNVK